jgi:hypothetical protein
MIYLGEVLDKALEANLERQMVMQSNRAFLPPHSWLKEFATIRLDYGRQTGKTTAIKRRASSRDLVVQWRGSLSKDFSSEVFFNPQVVTLKDLEYPHHKLRGHSYDRIWVDNASMVTDEQLNLVYYHALLCSAKQIILIG